MDIVFILLPLAIALSGFGLAAFLWATRNHQFEDLDGEALRPVLDDDEPPPAPPI